MADQFHGRPVTPYTHRAGPCLNDRMVPFHGGVCAHTGERQFHTVDMLYRRHHSMVYRYCLGMMRAPEAADDAAQSTWLHAMVALAAPAIVVRNSAAWLRTIARNQCLDTLRANGAKRTQDIGTMELSAPSTTESECEVREQLQSLLADLRTLSERQRTAITLRELGGLSSRQLEHDAPRKVALRAHLEDCGSCDNAARQRRARAA